MTRTTREYAVTLAALLAGGVLCLAASGLSWGTAHGSGPAATAADVTGGELLPPVQGVGLLALPAVVAVHATRRWGRRVVGAVLLVAGLVTAGWAVGVALELSDRVLQHAGGPSGAGEFGSATASVSGPVLAVTGSALIALAGVAVLVRGTRWPAMGARYVRAAPGHGSGAGGGRSAWESLDRGEDPTV